MNRIPPFEQNTATPRQPARVGFWLFAAFIVVAVLWELLSLTR